MHVKNDPQKTTPNGMELDRFRSRPVCCSTFNSVDIFFFSFAPFFRGWNDNDEAQGMHVHDLQLLWWVASILFFRHWECKNHCDCSSFWLLDLKNFNFFFFQKNKKILQGCLIDFGKS